nr:MAG TPA: hypothetical protein [Caudoviricetes sp.]
MGVVPHGDVEPVRAQVVRGREADLRPSAAARRVRDRYRVVGRRHRERDRHVRAAAGADVADVVAALPHDGLGDIRAVIPAGDTTPNIQ